MTGWLGAAAAIGIQVALFVYVAAGVALMTWATKGPRVWPVLLAVGFMLSPMLAGIAYLGYTGAMFR